MDSNVAMNTTCHFLRVPPEIRLNIYRYLLLECPRASLDPSYPEKDFNRMMDLYQKHVDFIDSSGLHNDQDQSALMNENDFYVPKPDFYKYSYNNPGGAVMYNHLIADQPDPPWETQSPAPIIDEEVFANNQVKADEKRIAGRKRRFENEYKVRRYPAILSTNHQIYDEASTSLYSTLVMEVRPGDVMSSDTWYGIVQPSGGGIWRSCPSVQPGLQHLTGGLEENQLSNLGGTMDPHVFAKFKRISFIVDLNFVAEYEEEVTIWPTFFVDDKFRTSREDEDMFITRLNGEGTTHPPVSDIFQRFVDLVSRSSYIRHLDINLGVRVEAAFDIESGNDVDGEEYGEGWESESFIERFKTEEKKMRIADERGVELVLEAGMLDPLKRLDKVKCFRLGLASLVRDGEMLFKPKPRVLELRQDLEETVEGEFCG